MQENPPILIIDSYFNMQTTTDTSSTMSPKINH